MKVVGIPKEDDPDSVRRSRRINYDDRARGQQVLMHAQKHYTAMDRYRRDRERNKRYAFGDQWGDTVVVDGVPMTEGEYIREQGNQPLKTNLIRRAVSSVVGLYRGQSMEPTCIARDRDEQRMAESMSTALQYNMELNHMNEMHARTMEEYLIGGFVVHRKGYYWQFKRMDCWTSVVRPSNFFIDCNMNDFRGWDCSIVGEIHDVSYEEVCHHHAKNPLDYAKIAEIYKQARDLRSGMLSYNEFGYGDKSVSKDFLFPQDASMCRVIEVWRKETKPRYRCHDYNTGEIYKVDVEDYASMVLAENERRRMQGLSAGMLEEDIPYIKAEWFVDSFWYYYILTPMGDILDEGETPYKHGSHPYVFKAYPFIDGEIHSFVADLIDTQRTTNRMLMLQDFIIKSSAKGVLMVPEDCLNGADPKEFADTWSKFNGVLLYKPSKSGQVPHQVSANSTNIGINEVLSMNLKFMEDISGVHNALQGKQGYSGTSAALYNMQTQNATTSLLDILESFGDFVKDAAYKDMNNIQQFYTRDRWMEIVGKDGAVMDNPDKMSEIEFDLSIVQSQATPAYRAIFNDMLMELFRAQAISVEQLLQVGSFPFADELLQSINSQKEQMQNGQMPEGVSPELLQRAQGQIQADPNAMAQLQRAVA